MQSFRQGVWQGLGFALAGVCIAALLWIMNDIRVKAERGNAAANYLEQQLRQQAAPETK